MLSVHRRTPQARPPRRAARARRTARAQTHRFGLLSIPRAHTKPPYKTDVLRETLRARSHPERGRTEQSAKVISTEQPAWVVDGRGRHAAIRVHASPRSVLSLYLPI